MIYKKRSSYSGRKKTKQKTSCFWDWEDSTYGKTPPKIERKYFIDWFKREPNLFIIKNIHTGTCNTRDVSKIFFFFLFEWKVLARQLSKCWDSSYEMRRLGRAHYFPIWAKHSKDILKGLFKKKSKFHSRFRWVWIPRRVYI